MKVKIGEKVYSIDDGPIMVILTEQDKKNISNMHPDATKYAIVEKDEMSSDELKEWMGA